MGKLLDNFINQQATLIKLKQEKEEKFLELSRKLKLKLGIATEEEYTEEEKRTYCIDPLITALYFDDNSYKYNKENFIINCGNYEIIFINSKINENELIIVPKTYKSQLYKGTVSSEFMPYWAGTKEIPPQEVIDEVFKYIDENN